MVTMVYMISMLHGGCYHVGGDDPGCVSFLLIFFCLFLVPLQGTMDRWNWVYLTLTIVQNPHAHCANCENHYVLEHVGYTNLAHCAQWGRCLWRMVCWLLLRQCGRSSTKENCNLQDKRKHPKLIWNIVGLLHKWREQDPHKLACAGLLQNRQEFESDLPPQNPSKFQQVVKIHRKKPWLGSSAFFIAEKIWCSIIRDHPQKNFSHINRWELLYTIQNFTNALHVRQMQFPKNNWH